MLPANGGTPAVLFLSTGAVYGSGAEGRRAESVPARSENPYAASKHAVEALLAYHAATGSVGACVLRCFSVAGACDGVGDADDTRILPKALCVAAGMAPAVRINGDGSAIREFTHVLDVAEACRLALDATQPGEHRLFTVGSGLAVSMHDLVDAVAERTGQDIPVEKGPPKPEPHTLMADSSKMRDELGWTAPASTLPLFGSRTRRADRRRTRPGLCRACRRAIDRGRLSGPFRTALHPAARVPTLRSR